MDEIVVFHYHLLPGGVTQVISSGLKALALHDTQIRSIRIVTGRRQNVDNFLQELSESVESAGISINIDIFPAIDYLDRSFTDNGYTQEKAKFSDQLANELLKQFGSEQNVWWIHNYHLGKNPVFTYALIKIITHTPSQRMILHIHDFPECGRYANFNFLRKYFEASLYRINSNIRFVVINVRDYQILISAGIPEEIVFLLDDPISLTSFKPSLPKQTVRSLLKTYAQQHGFTFREDGYFLLYPVRTIRRKNVLEAALISRLAGDEYQLVVTLPGVSEQEKNYSNLVKGAFLNKQVRGVWGVGEALNTLGLRFDDLVSSCDVLISSSVQEGFGYFFLNALLWSLPILSRDLDILQGIRDTFQDHPHFFYDNMYCPLPETDRKFLKKAYTKKLEKLKELFSGAMYKEMQEKLTTMFAEELVDFSYLTPALQFRVLQEMSNERYKGITSEANGIILSRLKSLIHSSPRGETERLDQRFGLAAFAESMRAVLTSFETQIRGINAYDPENVQVYILSYFLKKEYLRLLYE